MENKEIADIEDLKPVKSDFNRAEISRIYKAQGLKQPHKLAQKECDQYLLDFEKFHQYYADKITTENDIEIFLDHARYFSVAAYHKFHHIMYLQDQLSVQNVEDWNALNSKIGKLQSDLIYWQLQGVYQIANKALEAGQTSWEVRLEGALGLPHELDYNQAYFAYQGVSMRPEDRAIREQNGFAGATIVFYDRLLPEAKSDKQKQVLLECLNDFKQKYLDKRLGVLGHMAGTMSSAITGDSNFPTKRNRSKLKRLDIEEELFLKWYEAAYTYGKSAILRAATDAEKKELAWQKYQKGIIEDIAAIIAIDNGDMAGFDRSAFVNSAARKLRALPTAELASRGLALVEKAQQDMKKPVFTARHSIWKLVSEVTKNLEDEAIQEEDSILETFEGGEIRDTPSCDRVQIYFEDKPSEVVRRGLKSSAWRWSPKNEVWQRKRTDNARVSAQRIIKDIYLPDRVKNNIVIDEPQDNSVSIMTMIEEAKKQKIKEGKKRHKTLVSAGLKPEEPKSNLSTGREKLDPERGLNFKDKQAVLLTVTDYFLRLYEERKAEGGFVGMTDQEIKELLKYAMADQERYFKEIDCCVKVESQKMKISASFQSQMIANRSPILSGLQIVKMVRDLYKIPDPENSQGDLFL